VVWLSAPSWAILAATVCTAKHMKEKGAGSQLPPKFRQLSLEIKNGGSVVFFSQPRPCCACNCFSLSAALMSSVCLCSAALGERLASAGTA
jgi:hypothetical protein